MNGFLIRWAMAFVLLAATYNPTDWNYVSWTMVNFNRETAMMVLMGLLLMAGYIIYLRATLRSIGMIGMGLVSAIVAAGVWVLIDQDIIQLGNATVKVWFVLVGLSFVLGIGLSWSFVRRAMSGQYDVDDADD
ncbi:MAG: DUF6524 family protein [Rhodobacterales bacterium]